MNKKLLFLALALLTAMPSWCIEETWEDDEVPNQYVDPTTNVVYVYDPETLTAKVKDGDRIDPDCLDCDPLLMPGSPKAKGDIAILDKITVDDCDYVVTEIGSWAFAGLSNR